MSQRMVRVNELLKREIADDLYRIMNDAGFDLAAVTVTKVITSPDLRHAQVRVSIRGDEEERMHMFRQLLNHRKDIQKKVGKNVTLKYTPQLKFELDDSLAKGDHVLHILHELEQEEAPDTEGNA